MLMSSAPSCAEDQGRDDELADSVEARGQLILTHLQVEEMRRKFDASCCGRGNEEASRVLVFCRVASAVID